MLHLTLDCIFFLRYNHPKEEHLKRIIDHFPKVGTGHLNFVYFWNSYLNRRSVNIRKRMTEKWLKYTIEHSMFKLAKAILTETGIKLSINISRVSMSKWNEFLQSLTYDEVETLKNYQITDPSSTIQQHQYMVRRQKIYLNRQMQNLGIPAEQVYQYLPNDYHMYQPGMYRCSECSFSTPNEQVFRHHTEQHNTMELDSDDD